MAGKRYYASLDILRVVSALVIVSYHYGAEMAFLAPASTQGPGFMLLVRLTELAINVFFLISGASLALGYGLSGPAPHWRRYAAGRAAAIYPMYWLGFGALFLYGEVLHGNNAGIPRWRVVFSLLGLDGYLQQFTPTFYKIGEWFLGCLLILYLLFPALAALLRAIHKHPLLGVLPAAGCVWIWLWLPVAGAGIQYTHTVLWRLPVFFIGIAAGDALAKHPTRTWLPPRLHRPLRWLAAQCYGVFLVHHVLLTVVWAPHLAWLGYWPGYFLYVPASFGLGWCLHLAAQPLSRLLRRALGG